MNTISENQAQFLHLPEGSYYALNGLLPIDYGFNVTLASTGAGASIDAQGLSQVFKVDSGGVLALHKIHLLNGRGTDGGALYMNGGSTAHLFGCTISNCSATSASFGGGGAICASSDSIAILSECTIVSCVAATNGGALFVNRRSEAHLTDCSLINSLAYNWNGADKWGGAVFLSDRSTVKFTTCLFSNSSVSALGHGYVRRVQSLS
jgi:hypothetical protein